jgi:hypothetical protein
VLDLNSHHQSIRDSFQWDHRWTWYRIASLYWAALSPSSCDSRSRNPQTCRHRTNSRIRARVIPPSGYSLGGESRRRQVPSGQHARTRARMRSGSSAAPHPLPTSPLTFPRAPPPPWWARRPVSPPPDRGILSGDGVIHRRSMPCHRIGETGRSADARPCTQLRGATSERFDNP